MSRTLRTLRLLALCTAPGCSLSGSWYGYCGGEKVWLDLGTTSTPLEGPITTESEETPSWGGTLTTEDGEVPAWGALTYREDFVVVAPRAKGDDTMLMFRGTMSAESGYTGECGVEPWTSDPNPDSPDIAVCVTSFGTQCTDLSTFDRAHINDVIDNSAWAELASTFELFHPWPGA